MKLVVVIPCLNEAATLPRVLAQIPTTFEGVSAVQVLVVDDGSTDGTADVARAAGAVVHRLPQRRGLARAFVAGLSQAIRMGADVVATTDGDDQYPGRFLPALISPVLRGDADVVIGDRRPHQVEHFSPTKRLLQRLGGVVVRQLVGQDVADPASGMRALSREAALRLCVVSDFSYTMETLLHAAEMRLAITNVPIEINAPTRSSRLFNHIHQYVFNSGFTLLRTYVMFRPLPTLMRAAGVFGAVGGALLLRFAYYHLTLPQSGHVQSVVIAAACLVLSLLLAVAGVLADLVRANRRLLEEILYRQRRAEVEALSRRE